jgi:hypothetical protein
MLGKLVASRDDGSRPFMIDTVKGLKLSWFKWLKEERL